VAAGWMVRTSPTEYLPGGTSQGALVTTNPKGKRIVKVIDIGQDRDAEHLFSWVPGEDGGYLFSPHTTGTIKRTNSDLKNFNGRNENLEVRFPGSRVSINATLIRASTDSDAALIKVDSPQLLMPMEMSIDDVVKPGDKIIVLGYPGISDKTVGVFTTHEGGLRRQRVEHIPEPTVTEGIISRVGTAETQLESGMRVLGQMGDAIQLSVSGTGSGNSGGPVFNNAGKVIGLWTWGRSLGGVRVGFAVPIKHGRSLLQPQRIQ
jgi:serine protease Do